MTTPTDGLLQVAGKLSTTTATIAVREPAVLPMAIGATLKTTAQGHGVTGIQTAIRAPHIHHREAVVTAR